MVFSPGLWGTYHALMRADFTLFDEYAFAHDGEPFACRSTCREHAPWDRLGRPMGP